MSVATPLRPIGIALSALANILPEMEFWFPSEGIAAHRLDALCRTHLLDGRARPALPDRTLRGMLKGFADLVFEHDGRYWILDYKSNALGADDDAYTHDALEASMAAHRYDVQAAIYLLALHRLLPAAARRTLRADPSARRRAVSVHPRPARAGRRLPRRRAAARLDRGARPCARRRHGDADASMNDTRAAVLRTIEDWADRGWIRSLDAALAPLRRGPVPRRLGAGAARDRAGRDARRAGPYLPRARRIDRDRRRRSPLCRSSPRRAMRWPDRWPRCRAASASGVKRLQRAKRCTSIAGATVSSAPRAASRSC